MNKLDKEYTDLLQDIMDNGVVKGDRTGTGTVSVFGRQIRHNMSDGFPLLTTKKMPWRVIVTELIWFLKGDTNIQYLVKNGCNIWNGDAYQAFLHNPQKNHIYSSEAGQLLICPTVDSFADKIKTDDEFAKIWGELGPIYGAQWRNWDGIDQIANLIHDLRNNPDSRRLIVNAWNVGEIKNMTLPPCHYGFQCYTRELTIDERANHWFNKNKPARDWVDHLDELDEGKQHEFLNGCKVPERELSLMWNQRSVDTFLGLPFNIASYGLLLEILAKEVNMIPSELIGNLGDTHLYSNHVEQAKVQIGLDENSIEFMIKLAERHPEKYAQYLEIKNKKSDCIMNQEYENASNLRTEESNMKNELIRLMSDQIREPYPLPTLLFKDHLSDFDSIIEILRVKDFVLDNYQSHSTIKAPLSN